MNVCSDDEREAPAGWVAGERASHAHTCRPLEKPNEHSP